VAFAFGRALGPAVVRNRLRRRLRVLLTAASLPPGWYLFGGRPDIVERPFDALRVDVAQIVATATRAQPPRETDASCG
jgi:RNase P protein component